MLPPAPNVPPVSTQRATDSLSVCSMQRHQIAGLLWPQQRSLEPMRPLTLSALSRPLGIPPGSAHAHKRGLTVLETPWPCVCGEAGRRTHLAVVLCRQRAQCIAAARVPALEPQQRRGSLGVQGGTQRAVHHHPACHPAVRHLHRHARASRSQRGSKKHHWPSPERTEPCVSLVPHYIALLLCAYQQRR